MNEKHLYLIIVVMWIFGFFTMYYLLKKHTQKSNPIITNEFEWIMPLNSEDSVKGFTRAYLHVKVVNDTVKEFWWSKEMYYNQKLYNGTKLRKAKFR